MIRYTLQLMYCKYSRIRPILQSSFSLQAGIFARSYLYLVCFIYFYLPRAGGALREHSQRLCGGTVTVAFVAAESQMVHF